jgi:hypothetical protein
MQTNYYYAIHYKTWVKDPDRNEWEVLVVLEDNLPETNQAKSCCASMALAPAHIFALCRGNVCLRHEAQTKNSIKELRNETLSYSYCEQEFKFKTKPVDVLKGEAEDA